ncbi:unnamed protein product [Alopecurus aequalis]
MALRNLAARMRNPAAAALRLPPPALRVSPPAGARPRFSSSTQGHPVYPAKLMYQVNRQVLDRLKKQEEAVKRRVLILNVGKEALSWSFKLLLPIPFAGAILKATTK